jgi:hypothetical protein
MNGPMLPLIDLSLDATNPVSAHVVRFARDVAWRHRNLDADPIRFRAALEGYYRAWRVSQSVEPRPLDARVLGIAIAAYRDAHRKLHGPRLRNERPTAA